MSKSRIQAYVERELHDWIKRKVREGVFRSESHAIEYALRKYHDAVEYETPMRITA